MRGTLLESLLRGPFTEKAPLGADGDIARMAAELDVSAQRRLGRSLSLRGPATHASWNSMR
jgi:hypothetical protein